MRVAFQPFLDLGMLVCGTVVGHQIKVEGLGRIAIDGPQKAQELLVTMAWHAFANDCKIASKDDPLLEML